MNLQKTVLYIIRKIAKFTGWVVLLTCGAIASLMLCYMAFIFVISDFSPYFMYESMCIDSGTRWNPDMWDCEPQYLVPRYVWNVEQTKKHCLSKGFTWLDKTEQCLEIEAYQSCISLGKQWDIQTFACKPE